MYRESVMLIGEVKVWDKTTCTKGNKCTCTYIARLNLSSIFDLVYFYFFIVVRLACPHTMLLTVTFAVYFPQSVYCSKQKINLFLNSKYFKFIFLLNFEVILFLPQISELEYIKLPTKYVIINYLFCSVDSMLVALVDDTGAWTLVVTTMIFWCMSSSRSQCLNISGTADGGGQGGTHLGLSSCWCRSCNCSLGLWVSIYVCVWATKSETAFQCTSFCFIVSICTNKRKRKLY